MRAVRTKSALQKPVSAGSGTRFFVGLTLVIALYYWTPMLPPTLFVYLYQFFLYAIAGLLLWLLERRLVHGPFRKK
jgi:hypothetical protein